MKQIAFAIAFLFSILASGRSLAPLVQPRVSVFETKILALNMSAFLSENEEGGDSNLSAAGDRDSMIKTVRSKNASSAHLGLYSNLTKNAVSEFRFSPSDYRELQENRLNLFFSGLLTANFNLNPQTCLIVASDKNYVLAPKNVNVFQRENDDDVVIQVANGFIFTFERHAVLAVLYFGHSSH